MSTVHLDQMTFTMQTTLAGKHPVNTLVTLEACDVQIDAVANALTAGASRRTVRQGVFKKDEKVPTELSITWDKWIGKPERSTIVVETREPTPEEMRARAKESPEYRLKLRELLQQLESDAGEK